MLNEPCGICFTDIMTCPLKYKCGHYFCMQCVYPNRKNPILKKCPMCREVDYRIDDNSPIFKLCSNVNFVKFYSDFTKKNMIQITAEELDSKIGKYVVLEYTTRDTIKNTVENISFIGVMTSYNELTATLENCYHVNKDTPQIYPTMPDIKNLKIKPETVIYAED